MSEGSGATPPNVDDLAENLQASAEFAENMSHVLTKSQEIWAQFLQSDNTAAAAARPDPLNTTPAFAELATAMFTHPQEVADAAMDYWTSQGELWRRATMKMLGEETEPLIEPEPGDKRFKDADWTENNIFDYVKQSYLLTSQWITDTVHNVGEMEDLDRRKVDFYTRAMIEAISPTNFAASNPEVLRATVAEKGENLVRGLDNMLQDLERGKGKLAIRQTDMDAFKVGENMALSPGKVVFQNDLFQLIQYAPTTDKVHERPLLFVPPWINKFYILDLNDRKSMVKWLVGQGYTVFMTSWVNPDASHRDKTWKDYVTEGVSVALDKVIEETGAPSVNVAAYCIGGTLMGTALSHFQAKDDKRVESCTFFTTQIDFTNAGELQIFVDDQTLEVLEEEMDDKGYLAAENMANGFNLLRSSDLIWGFIVQNYMLGKDPFPFDLLYWNSDSTCMPAKVHKFYLESFYKDNKLALGEMDFGEGPLDPSKVKIPLYHVAAREDHIAPPESVYRGTKFFGGQSRFVLAGSGHIAGVVNPPALEKYQYWTNRSAKAATLDEWMTGATETPGSWWPDWDKWLARRSGSKVAARTPGETLKPIEDAPGSYVRERSDNR